MPQVIRPASGSRAVQGWSQAPSTYACCCCGTTGNSYRRLDASWAQYGFVGAHSSFNSSEKVLTPTNVGALVPIGQADLGPGAPSAPVVANGVAYVATGGSILAIDVKTRAQIWSSLSCSGSPAAEVAYANNRVFAGDSEGDLAAYDAATGALLWCRDAGGSIQSAPAVDGNTVYISTQGDVVAVDQATGNARWRFTVTGTPGPSSSPAVGSQIYVTGPGAVYAIRKSDGRLLWKRALGGSYTLSAPAVSGDTVYVGADGFYAPPQATEDPWTSHAAGVNVSMPAISGADSSSIRGSSVRSFALNAGNGSLVWRSTSTGESLTSPSVRTASCTTSPS
jgi:outer membrane protein assembly factor BamB